MPKVTVSKSEIGNRLLALGVGGGGRSMVQAEIKGKRRN